MKRPQEMCGEFEDSIKPGTHKPQAGEHTVVWWDPAVLHLGVEPGVGLRQEEILASPGKRSQYEYQRWLDRKENTIDRGVRPQFDVFLATDCRPLPEGVAVDVETHSTERELGRPGGARFGTLVHNMLRDVAYDAAGEAIGGLATLHGRLTGAPQTEVNAAHHAVMEVLSHELVRRARGAARSHREWPIRAALHGSMFEGILDLAFLEEGVWHIVDFKTDAYDPALKKRYEVQLGWYVLALAKLTGTKVQAHLLRA